jgi:choline/glycine/proline betaine transport protein
MEPPVFFGSAALVVGFVLVGVFATDTAADAFSAAQTWITRTFGWWYMLAATGFLVVAGVFIASPARKIRIGGPGAKPDFSRPSWFAMLFAAGMGTGLVFWSVAEPLTHFAEPPPGFEPRTPAAEREAMRLAFFHWGLNAWGVYAILALAVALLHFNRKLPLAPRSILQPLFGRGVMEGPAGHGVDILCTVGTLLGVSTSLGLGAMQINAGLERFLGWPLTTPIQIGLIAGITAIATASVVIGLSGGLRRLSEANLILASALLAFVLLAGPTGAILETFTATTGLYLQSWPRSTLFVDFARETDWQATWTLFYWGWWISWAPFVAIFAARISKGRSVGEFLAVMLAVPTLATFLWLSVFGGAALSLETSGAADIAARAVDEPAIALHALLEALPLAPASLFAATLIIFLFFVTSSDSGSFVDDMVTSGGDPNPPRAQRVFWAVSEGAVAGTLLLAGGLSAIRNAAIALGLPMSVVLALAAVASVRVLLGEQRGIMR